MDHIEDIFASYLNKTPDAATMNEANDRTIPSGTYKLEITQVDREAASDKSPWPGRPMVRVKADAFYQNGDGTWHRRGRLNFDLSPQVNRFEKNGQLDTQSKLFANMVNVTGKGSTLQDVLDYLGQYPLTASVVRTFKTIDGRWVTPKTQDQANELLRDGAEPRNFVQSLRPFKG